MSIFNIILKRLPFHLLFVFLLIIINIFKCVSLIPAYPCLTLIVVIVINDNGIKILTQLLLIAINISCSLTILDIYTLGWFIRFLRSFGGKRLNLLTKILSNFSLISPSCASINKNIPL